MPAQKLIGPLLVHTCYNKDGSLRLWSQTARGMRPSQKDDIIFASTEERYSPDRVHQGHQIRLTLDEDTRVSFCSATCANASHTLLRQSAFLQLTAFASSSCAKHTTTVISRWHVDCHSSILCHRPTSLMGGLAASCLQRPACYR